MLRRSLCRLGLRTIRPASFLLCLTLGLTSSVTRFGSVHCLSDDPGSTSPGAHNLQGQTRFASTNAEKFEHVDRMPVDTAELSKLSVSELKKQIHDRGEGTADCLEKSDLVNKLCKIMEKETETKKDGPKATGDGGAGSPGSVSVPKKNVDKNDFGRVAFVGNKRNPSGIMLIMHGLGDTCDGWAQTAEMLADVHPQLLFILPTAATIAVTLNMGMKMPAWYDITSLNPGASEDDRRILDSASYANALAEEAMAKYNLGPDSVVYGGFSQGSVVALHAGLNARAGKPRGILMMSGYFGGRTQLLTKAQHKDVPVLMCHGTADNVIPLQVAMMSSTGMQTLLGLSNLEFKQYPGMAHSASQKELDDITAWLRKRGF
jgi:predicted esterase